MSAIWDAEQKWPKDKRKRVRETRSGRGKRSGYGIVREIEGNFIVRDKGEGKNWIFQMTDENIVESEEKMRAESEMEKFAQVEVQNLQFYQKLYF